MRFTDQYAYTNPAPVNRANRMTAILMRNFLDKACEKTEGL